MQQLLDAAQVFAIPLIKALLWFWTVGAVRWQLTPFAAILALPTLRAAAPYVVFRLYSWSRSELATVH